MSSRDEAEARRRRASERLRDNPYLFGQEYFEALYGQRFGEKPKEKAGGKLLREDPAGRKFVLEPVVLYGWHYRKEDAAPNNALAWKVPVRLTPQIWLGGPLMPEHRFPVRLFRRARPFSRIFIEDGVPTYGANGEIVECPCESCALKLTTPGQQVEA